MALTEAAFARTINFDDPSVRKDKPPEYATLEQEKAWWKAYNEWNAKPKAAGGDSPFLDYTKGYNNIPSVSDYGTGNTPPHWTSLYGAIQSGSAKITGSPEEGFSIVDRAGNPQSGSVEQVAPGVYSIKTGSGQYSANFVVGADPTTGYVSPITDMSKQYNSWRHAYSGGGLSGAVQGLTQGLMDLGPLGKIALAYAIAQTGGALGGALGIPAAAGTALVSGGLQLAQGADLSDAIKSAATGALLSTAAQGISSSLTPSTDTGLLSAGTTPTTQIPTVDIPATSDLYSLAPSTPTSGLGLNPTIGEGTNLFSTGTNVGTDALGTGLTLPETSNLASMGGGQGLTVPAAGGGLLGEAGVGNAVTAVTNPVTGQPLGQELSNINTGVTDVTGTPISQPAQQNPLQNQVIKNILGKLMADNTNLTSLGGGLLTGAGGALQGEAARAAAQQIADRMAATTGAAVSGAQFRPVGITTRFGASNFQVNPQTGQLESAGYTPSALSEQLQQGAQGVYNLGQSYVAQSPQEAAANWMQAQQALLAPSRDVALSNLRNQVFQSGREGLSMAQGGNLQAANPEMAAYYNSLANQNALLASQAQQMGQQQAQFGTGLLGSGLNLMSGLNTLEQQPLALGAGLGAQAATAGARAGQLGIGGTQAGQNYLYNAASYSPFGNLLSAAGQSQLGSQAVGNLLSQYAPQLGNWLTSFLAPTGGLTDLGNTVLNADNATNFWSY